jgi:hypothetical protein
VPQDTPTFTIAEESPTPIVRDFCTFLEALEKPSVYLTQARQTLDRATLYAADQAMRTFRAESHPRMDQQYYPLLHLFQRLCMAARLYVVCVDKGKQRPAPTDRLAEFRALSPTEKYVALLDEPHKGRPRIEWRGVKGSRSPKSLP